MATLKIDYRIGLSATPYREDGRTNYIFALTGHPLALNWRKFFELNIVTKPTITLYLFRSYKQKMRKVEELCDEPRKSLIFVWSLDVGRSLQKLLGFPFINHKTPGPDRIKTIRENQQTIVSSIASEGISISDLERVIEFDWFGKSRREEVQRLGRLFHTTKKQPQHIILMTESEFVKDEERLFGIYDKGFRVNIIR